MKWNQALAALAAAVSLSFSHSCLGQEELSVGPDDWDRYILGFRKAHTFSSVCGISGGTWIVRGYGPSQLTRQEERGYFCKGEYSFHLRLAGQFGYFLGSSAGYHYPRAASLSPILIPSSVQYPSFLGGFAWNSSNSIRMSVGLDFYLERFDGIRRKDSSESFETALTANGVDAIVAIDVFYSLGWAIRVTYRSRFLDTTPPADIAGDENLPLAAYFKKKDQWTGLGLVVHLI